jgi:hypothetical protein
MARTFLHINSPQNATNGSSRVLGLLVFPTFQIESDTFSGFRLLCGDTMTFIVFKKSSPDVVPWLDFTCYGSLSAAIVFMNVAAILKHSQQLN